MDRYTVTKAPTGRKRWVITDAALGGAYCTLPDDPTADRPNLLPLEWRTRQGALAFLQQARRVWASGAVQAPEGALPGWTTPGGMTLRVSTNGGRDYGPQRLVRGDEPLGSATWPPCRCYRCRN